MVTDLEQGGVLLLAHLGQVVQQRHSRCVGTRVLQFAQRSNSEAICIPCSTTLTTKTQTHWQSPHSRILLSLEVEQSPRPFTGFYGRDIFVPALRVLSLLADMHIPGWWNNHSKCATSAVTIGYTRASYSVVQTQLLCFGYINICCIR